MSIVLYPTDTVYGLGVDARDREAVLRLRKLKGNTPVLIRVGAISELAIKETVV